MAENQALASVVRFAAALHEQGVRQVCISPGSRSTPLTMAIARHGGFSVHSILDERSAGFFAVGLARASGEPVVLVCTSGTAVGNYLPAVMEAHNARLPLLVLTADRPPELHGVGANQTVEQAGLFRNFTQLTVEMPVPGDDVTALRHANAVALRVTAQLKRNPGPIHVNWPLREPLIPPANVEALDDVGTRLWATESPRLAQADATRLAELFCGTPRGLIVVGPMDSDAPGPHVLELANQLGWPVLADPLSQIRGLGAHPGAATIVDGYDAFLRSDGVRQSCRPQLVLRFGRTPTSKVLGQYLQSLQDVLQFVVDEADRWHDPFFTATDLVACPPAAFCQQAAGHVRFMEDRSWLSHWQRLNQTTQAALRAGLAEAEWWEGQIYTPLINRLKIGSNLFVGNSMPVRDLDTFMAVGKPLRVFANRGVSGIDGVTSSACGVAAATGKQTVLVIGDVSFYHDLNALLLPSRLQIDLLVIVANNDGGGIFSFLPQRAYPETFAHFGTPHGLTFAGAAEQFGAWYAKASDQTGYEEALNQALNRTGLRIIELAFTVDPNLDAHKRLFADVAARVESECLT